MKRTHVCSFLNWALAALVGLSSLGLCSCGNRSGNSSQADISSFRHPEDFSVLYGTWRRSDGGYLLHIARVASNGDMVASYFNPVSIHVAKAVVSRDDGSLKVLAELRDVNYPGSTYSLTYDPADDRLKGTYYQAVFREIFQISFVRVKP